MGLSVRALRTDGKMISIGVMTHGDWGQYLGKHDGKYVVLTTAILYQPHGIAEYDTIEEMKREWCLD